VASPKKKKREKGRGGLVEKNRASERKKKCATNEAGTPCRREKGTKIYEGHTTTGIERLCGGRRPTPQGEKRVGRRTAKKGSDKTLPEKKKKKAPDGALQKKGRKSYKRECVQRALCSFRWKERKKIFFFWRTVNVQGEKKFPKEATP